MQLIQMDILFDKKETGTIMSFTAEVKSFEICAQAIKDISVKLDLVNGRVSFSLVEEDFDQRPVNRCKVLSSNVCVLYSEILSFVVTEDNKTGLSNIDVRLVGCHIFGNLESAQSYLVAKELMK